MPKFDKQHAGSECEPTVIIPSLSRAFFASILITGDQVLAEGAVMDAIDVLSADETDACSGALLMDNSIEAALRAESERGIPTSCEEKEVISLLLPGILRNVLRLDRNPRLCFVLRVLLGVTRERCANQLQLEAFQVDTFTVAAMCDLAALPVYEQLNYSRSAAQH